MVGVSVEVEDFRQMVNFEELNHFVSLGVEPYFFFRFLSHC